jgi:hypothetical protein
LDVSCTLLSATESQVAWAMRENVRYVVGAKWGGRNHYVPCTELNSVPVVGCSRASFVVGAVPTASHSVVGDNDRMIPLLRFVYAAWALGPA